MNFPGKSSSARNSAAPRRSLRAFTVLEVMIAAGIFFMCMFAILGVVFTTLRNARRLQEARVNAGPVAADVYYQTNKWEDGSSDNGDFGNLYPGYSWRFEMREALTNGLYQVDFLITRPDGVTETNLSVLYWRPGPVNRSGPPPRVRSQ